MHTTRGTTQHSYNKASALHRDILLVFKLIPYCDYYLLQVCVKSLEDPSSVVKGPDLLLTTSHCSACSKLEVPALLKLKLLLLFSLSLRLSKPPPPLLTNIRPLAYHFILTVKKSKK